MIFPSAAAFAGYASHGPHIPLTSPLLIILVSLTTSQICAAFIDFSIFSTPENSALRSYDCLLQESSLNFEKQRCSLESVLTCSAWHLSPSLKKHAVFNITKTLLHTVYFSHSIHVNVWLLCGTSLGRRYILRCSVSHPQRNWAHFWMFGQLCHGPSIFTETPEIMFCGP